MRSSHSSKPSLHALVAAVALPFWAGRHAPTGALEHDHRSGIYRYFPEMSGAVTFTPAAERWREIHLGDATGPEDAQRIAEQDIASPRHDRYDDDE